MSAAYADSQVHCDTATRTGPTWSSDTRGMEEGATSRGSRITVTDDPSQKSKGKVWKEQILVGDKKVFTIFSCIAPVRSIVS